MSDTPHAVHGAHGLLDFLRDGHWIRSTDLLALIRRATGVHLSNTAVLTLVALVLLADEDGLAVPDDLPAHLNLTPQAIELAIGLLVDQGLAEDSHSPSTPRLVRVVRR